MNSYRGHAIHEVDEVWYYEDNTLVSEDKNRACGYCSISNTPEGHDRCLGTLPNIMNACCGHGIVDDAYVQFLDGSCTRGENAKRVIQHLKNWRDMWGKND